VQENTMANLGTFSAAMREHDPDAAEPDTFDFYGETFTVLGFIPGIVELTISAALAGKASGVDGDAAMYEALRCALTAPATGDDRPDRSQWEKFYKLALDKDAPGELLTAVTLNVLGAQVGRPTERQSTSSDGQPPTSTPSNTSSSPSPDAPALRPVDEVLAGLPTSPDAS
jgi:hypothetical protein